MRIALAALSAAALMATTVVSVADVSDTEHLVDVMNRRLESQGGGVEVPWSNPYTGNSGIVVILGTDESGPEGPCRTYRYTIEEPSEPTVVVEGKACRIADFIWQRSEAQVSLAVDPDPDPDPDPAPVARSDPEPAEPPPHLPPAHKPDPDIFYASIPTPSVY